MKKKIIKKTVKKVEKKPKNKAIKKKEPIVSIEVLSHFRCGECKGWWSIGDAVLREKSDWFCPWCGVKNIFDK